MTDEQLFQIIKECLPENLSYKQDGGLLDPCKIEGTFGDILDFVRAIRQDGYTEGYDDGMCEANYSNPLEGIFSSNED